MISRKGFEDYLAVKDKLAAPLWISTGVISQSELESLRYSGADVTDFNYAISLNENEVIDDVIETIKEHHSGEVIWVQPGRVRIAYHFQTVPPLKYPKGTRCVPYPWLAEI